MTPQSRYMFTTASTDKTINEIDNIRCPNLCIRTRRNFYEYDRVSFKKHEITNHTLIYLTPKPNCLQLKNCESCVSNSTEQFHVSKLHEKIAICMNNLFRIISLLEFRMQMVSISEALLRWL